MSSTGKPSALASSCAASVTFVGANELPAGDFHTATVLQDNVVDITDFSVLAAGWNLPVDANLSTGADANGDGVQALADFTAIQLNFLTVGDAADACPGGASFTGDRLGESLVAVRLTPRTVVRLESLGLPEAHRADLNNDGWIDSTDIRLFARAHGLPLLPDFDRMLSAAESGKPGRRHR